MWFVDIIILLVLAYNTKQIKFFENMTTWNKLGYYL
jgi:hypothetical protein